MECGVRAHPGAGARIGLGFVPRDKSGGALKPRFKVAVHRDASALPWYAHAVEYKLFAAAEEYGVAVEELPEAVVRVAHRELQGLQETTETGYAEKWRRFERFCEAEQLCPLPATTTTVLSWMSEDLALTVKAENFQSYLSAVNKAHVHLELDKPAVGDRVTAVRQSIKGGQVPVTVEDQRVRLPADVVADALDEAVNGDVSNDLLRSTAAVVTDSACCSRGDTGVGIRDSDVRLRSDRGVVIRLRNHKGDVKRAELTGEERVLVFEPDAVVGLYEVLARWFLRRKALGLNDGVERSLWALPGEKRTLHWRQSRMNDFLSLILRVRNVKPPAGFKYSYHSLRHMAASSMKAIGVSDQKVKMMGRWKCIETVDDTYVDPACAATYGCYRLYGHLLPPLNRLEHLARRPEELRRWSCAGG